MPHHFFTLLAATSRSCFMSTNIFLVDDQPDLVSVLRDFLNGLPDVIVCGVAASGQEALAQLPTLSVALVLVDASLPDITGIELVKAIGAWRPALPCLMLSGYQDVARVRVALAAGALGYIVKGDPCELAEAIRLALNDEIYLSPQVRIRLTDTDDLIVKKAL
jgi:DNA-binding NarL/FixJ family response regulator